MMTRRLLEALTRLLTLSITKGHPLEDAHFSNAEALLFEHRQTPFSETLWPLMSEAYAVAGLFENAVNILVKKW